MPPKFNNARESAAPYNRAARRSSARSAPTTDATAPVPSSSLLKTPSPLRAVVSAPSSPPSPSGPSRKRRHDDDDDEEQVAEVAATSGVDSTAASSSLVTPPLSKKRRSVEPDSSVVVAAVVEEQVTALSSPSSPSVPTSSQLEAAPAPCAASPSPASSSSSPPPSSSPASPSLEASPAHSLASTAPSSPPPSAEPSSPASSSTKSLANKSSSTSDLPPSVAPAHAEVATSSSAGPTSRVDIGVQTDAAEHLADDSNTIVALRCSLEEANVKIVELERERDEKQTSNAKLSADLLASRATADLHRKHSEDLVSQGDSIFARLQSDLPERIAERDTAHAKITELESALEQLHAQVRSIEAGRLQDRQHAETSMQQLADSHTQHLAALTADYQAKQLDERKEAENAIQQLAESHAQHVAKLNDDNRAKQLESNEKAEQALKEQAEAHTRDLAAITTAHETKRLDDRTAAEKALKEHADAHAQEIAAITAKHQADVDEAKAYFANMTSQSEQLEREKKRAESALERSRKSSSLMKQVLHGLADAVKAMDPPLPCTICASLFSNLDTIGSRSHIPSASCAVRPANVPRIYIPEGNMRIVELESENDESGSDEASDDDDDDDSGMESESEDEDEGAGANNGPIIYNCTEDDSEDDNDVLPIDRRNMISARKVPGYERFYKPEAVEDVLNACPFIKENPGIWFRVIPHFLFSYDDEKDDLRIMARPPLGMFNFGE